ncbi:hypothetical protein PHYC_02581 [Phycisphaerales bacterium]|nr:hypothetical protein PHYC_02581 [Phycisphaerales bacterium]
MTRALLTHDDGNPGGTANRARIAKTGKGESAAEEAGRFRASRRDARWLPEVALHPWYAPTQSSSSPLPPYPSGPEGGGAESSRRRGNGSPPPSVPDHETRTPEWRRQRARTLPVGSRENSAPASRNAQADAYIEARLQILPEGGGARVFEGVGGQKLANSKPVQRRPEHSNHPPSSNGIHPNGASPSPAREAGASDLPRVQTAQRSNPWTAAHNSWQPPKGAADDPTAQSNGSLRPADALPMHPKAHTTPCSGCRPQPNPLSVSALATRAGAPPP